MPSQKLPLILASASPRRQELLSLFSIPFEVHPSKAEETAHGTGREQVGSIAATKCDDVFALYPDRFVLSADTLVCVDDAILGKPRDEDDAAAMLRSLSGRWHEVHTGVCLRGPGGYRDVRVETTRVQFTRLTDGAIRQYIATGEPMDKAGAYAIQGISGIFISRVEGSPSNVIGLPLESVAAMLAAAGIPFPLSPQGTQF